MSLIASWVVQTLYLWLEELPAVHSAAYIDLVSWNDFAPAYHFKFDFPVTDNDNYLVTINAHGFIGLPDPDTF
jgi:hypothetical protein